MSDNIIELHINNIMVSRITYNGKTKRREIISKWEKLYPIRKTQKRYMVLKPCNQ